MQPFENWQADFVAILEENKKIIKKNEQRFIPVGIIQPISVTFAITSQRLRTPFRKFAGRFRSYIRRE